MEVVFLEDPCCSWCWAFQPVETAFEFEYGRHLRPRRVMGGLRDYPIADSDFILDQWRLAAEVSGMPWEMETVRRHALQTTFVACRSVKAACMISADLASRLLRRLREAYYLEGRRVDELEVVLELAAEVGLDIGRIRDHLASGRADSLFERDREEASMHGFGYPTILVKQPTEERPMMLQGLVPYGDVVRTLASAGFSHRQRRRFQDRPEDWRDLFRLRSRLAMAELLLVTRLDTGKIETRLRELGARFEGRLYAMNKSSEEPAEDPRSDPAAFRAAVGE